MVGGPSLDRLVANGEAHEAPGGGGFITALAARAAGAAVGLVARVPTALPEAIARAFGPGGLDRAGLVTAAGALTRFVIEYDGAHRARYRAVAAGAEDGLCAADVPPAWIEGARWFHVASIAGSARAQLAFVEGLRARGYAGSVSAGTFPRASQEDAPIVRALAAACDLFFCNRGEAERLFPDPLPEGGPTLCVTDGPGAVVVRGGSHAGRYEVEPAPVVDATGAGDAFCGGFLAALLTGGEPASAGAEQAREVLGGYGATPLVDRVAASVGPRARPNPDRLDAVAAALSEAASGAAFDFAGFPFPDAGDPLALETLALATLHQYGFWTADETRWLGPMFATADGRRFKGSDYVWQAFTRAVRADPTVLDPARLAAEPDLFARICVADDGACPIPHLASHVALQRAYGAALPAGGVRGLVAAANASDRPAAALLNSLKSLPGYAEDPLAKKANLLVVVLAGRPERFLELRDPESVQPIVDYHLMRGCLRTGCVEVTDPELRRRMEGRRWIDVVEERAVREACLEGLRALVGRSGRSVADVDAFFFALGRSACLETEPPRCDECALAPRCARRTDAFQPVFRTTAY